VERSIEAFGVGSRLVKESADLRFDASFYNPRVIAAVRALEASDMGIKTLGEVCKQVYIPPRFKRVYVDAEHGVPFLQGSHIVQFQPADLKYLSRTAQKNLDKWIISAGWILVTCSGTIGRVAIAPSHWDGWAASQHILRIIPNENNTECPPGYLAAFLESPIGQAQLTAQIYGAVVDELTEDQARSVRVPVPVTRGQQTKVDQINEQMLNAVSSLSEAVQQATKAEVGIAALLPSPESPYSEPELTRDTRLKIDADPEDALRALLKPVRRRAAQ
jgi:type I restriction enzyme S subunit